MPLFVKPRGGSRAARAARARKGHSRRRGRNSLNASGAARYRFGNARGFRRR